MNVGPDDNAENEAATGRLPPYFSLEAFGIAGPDVVESTLHCSPSQVCPLVLLAPFWKHETFLQYADVEEEVVPRSLYTLRYRGRRVTALRSGVGAPLTGDKVLALACTPCERLVFVGSVGGLLPGMAIGDLVIPLESVSGDGFSRYLDSTSLSESPSLIVSRPNEEMTAALTHVATERTRGEDVSIQRGRIFTSDTILAQFHHLEEIVREHECIGIEMETAAVFRAAELSGIRAAALLQISDVSTDGKSLLSGRTPADHDRRHRIRRGVLSNIALDVLVAR